MANSIKSLAGLPWDVEKIKASIEYHTSTLEVAIESNDTGAEATLLRVVADCLESKIDYLRVAADKLEGK